MFSIRVSTPAVTSGDGLSYAGGELRIGDVSLKFVVDLTTWRIADYERQWRAAIDRLVRGAPATALLTGYHADADRPYWMWAMWRDDAFVYVQEHVVVPADLDAPFDPMFPEAHVGHRIAPEHGLPIPEWRTELIPVLASAFGLRWPLYPR